MNVHSEHLVSEFVIFGANTSLSLSKRIIKGSGAEAERDAVGASNGVTVVSHERMEVSIERNKGPPAPLARITGDANDPEGPTAGGGCIRESQPAPLLQTFRHIQTH